MKKPKALSSNPFEKLKKLKEELKKASPPTSKDSPLHDTKPSKEPDEDEKELFSRAMEGVKPISDKNEKFLPKPSAETKPISYPENQDEELQAIEVLRDLVRGKGVLDSTFGDEFFEYRSHFCNPRDFRKLKRGEIALESHLDLHGLTQEESRIEVSNFIRESRQKGQTCILIVTGRGKGSRDGKAVLREALCRWLSHGELSENIRAFCSALPRDGGWGAFYVYLS